MEVECEKMPSCGVSSVCKDAVYYTVGDPEKLIISELATGEQPDKTVKRACCIPKRPPPAKPTTPPNHVIRTANNNPSEKAKSTLQTKTAKPYTKQVKSRPPRPALTTKTSAQILEIKPLSQGESNPDDPAKIGAKIPANAAISQDVVAVLKHAGNKPENECLDDFERKPICPARPPTRPSKATKLQNLKEDEAKLETVPQCSNASMQNFSDGNMETQVLKKDLISLKSAPNKLGNNILPNSADEDVTAKEHESKLAEKTVSDNLCNKPTKPSSTLSSPRLPKRTVFLQMEDPMSSTKELEMVTKTETPQNEVAQLITISVSKATSQQSLPRRQPPRPTAPPPPLPSDRSSSHFRKEIVDEKAVVKAPPPRRPPPPSRDKVKAAEEKRRSVTQMSEEEVYDDPSLKQKEATNDKLNNIKEDDLQHECIVNDNIEASKDDFQPHPGIPTPTTRPTPARRTIL